MIKKELLAYSLLVIQPIFMASNLIIARGGVEFVPPIRCHWKAWSTILTTILNPNTNKPSKPLLAGEYFFYHPLN